VASREAPGGNVARYAATICWYNVHLPAHAVSNTTHLCGLAIENRRRRQRVIKALC
jgi:hypothetical protein